MRWEGQRLDAQASDALPGLARLNNLVRTVRTPEFAGMTFYEVLAKSALNKVPGSVPGTPYGWTINPYRGCSHACVYCFARPTHAYLDFDDAGAFDREVIVKVNVAEVLRAELRKRSWTRPPVALGTNTDPYQRAEGRYRLMPEILTALAQSGTPLSLLTKGTLLRRDLPLLEHLSASVPVDLAMSVAVFDDELQQLVEPGTPTATARLATVRAARDAGLPCGVFLMPVLPYLTDSVQHLDRALAAIKDSGASYVIWTALHLKPGVKEWYLGWLAQHHPEHEAAYRRMYAGVSYAPKAYRQWLADRMRPLLAKHRLPVGSADDATGATRSRSAGIVARPAPTVPAAQPVLF
ncbi:Rv2578c family radical SAM protein [Amnibacterium sp. CER49]|uniref:Rv2578c family radical SAM protein n=1 Tax=Amnibacterium sp. CER49 TaxID=3039161 RepID=UPI00244B6656|nr:Rv2578c family radical SAM protein [Amnibacterium sp. CER49]MDH2443226.1 Rv2578c family radical SAM protein [Amnibacterium sp. CER49]